MAYWLLKSEPDDWSWAEQVAKGRDGAEWTGIRNFAAQNHLRAMKKGEQAFFYHTGKERAIVGIVKVIAEAHPDSTDAAWRAVDVAAVEAAADTGRPRSDQGGQAPRRHGAGQAAAPVGSAGHGRRVACRLPDGRPGLDHAARPAALVSVASARGRIRRIARDSRRSARLGSCAHACPPSRAGPARR